jgi:hypothetical protein
MLQGVSLEDLSIQFDDRDRSDDLDDCLFNFIDNRLGCCCAHDQVASETIIPASQGSRATSGGASALSPVLSPSLSSP